ncbi:MAG: s-methyl-5-thioribose-1-phosphate isomerase [Clostridiaceae bacterium]|nr:s-methyl-5-thioribose-1-phosphate isomerase [Clostridiaceae bacterium]
MSESTSKAPRQDHDLGFLLRYENIAWFEKGLVRILDRRVYPTEIVFLECRTVDQVADAITGMVTQSAGPYTAAGMGMALAASQVKGQGKEKQLQALRQAAERLSTARPTTVSRMRRVTSGALIAAEKALAQGESDVTQILFDLAYDSLERRYERMSRVGSNLISLLPDRAIVMTNCFGETIIGTMIRAAQDRGLELKLFTPETRPYFQGARLTASVAAEMGADVTVITDNMPAEVFSRHPVDLYTTAADAITRDGYVVNKTGTLQIAIVAKYYGVPYFVTGIPDRVILSEVTIEQRDPQFVLEARGVRNTRPEVKGYYPSFDITPPHLVSGVVTDTGILTPYNLDHYQPPGGQADDYYGGFVV